MKILLVLAVLVSGSLMAGERVILKDSKEVDVEVSDKTVLCSALGYGNAELKINIAALDGWTIFDHSNVRFGDKRALPCMTAGECKEPWKEDGFEINDVLQNNPRSEKIVIQRELTESRTLFDNACVRSLRERLSTVVGGIPFHHERYGAESTLPAIACTF